MNTTALRSNTVLARNTAISAMVKEALHTTARDFVASLLGVTKATMLSQQSPRPRLRRF